MKINVWSWKIFLKIEEKIIFVYLFVHVMRWPDRNENIFKTFYNKWKVNTMWKKSLFLYQKLISSTWMSVEFKKLHSRQKFQTLKIIGKKLNETSPEVRSISFHWNSQFYSLLYPRARDIFNQITIIIIFKVLNVIHKSTWNSMLLGEVINNRKIKKRIKSPLDSSDCILLCAWA